MTTPNERAVERISDAGPAEILAPPTTGRILRTRRPAEPANARPRNAIDPRDIDLAEVQRQWERQLDRLLREWDGISRDQRDQIIDQVRAAITANDLAAVAAISVSTTQAAELLTAAMTEMALEAAQQLSREAQEQGVPIDPVASDSAWFQPVAVTVAALLGAATVNAAAREALRRWSPTTSGDDVAAAVREHLEGLSDVFLRDNLGGALSSAETTGRLQTMLAGPSAALYASEMLDSNTCPPCERINGKWLGNSDDPDIVSKVEAVYPSGNYRDCRGGVRCRGQVVAVYRPEQVTSGEAGG